MPKLKIYHQKSLSNFLAVRPGETKLGEKIQFVSKFEELSENDAQFVIFGIPEDIGVRANYGKAGTSNAWPACLKALLNVQDNGYLASEKLLLLGEVDCSVEMERAANLELSDPNYYEKMGELVESIDDIVSALVKEIIATGKIPIIIGGGHNNAFGNLKGASEAFQKAINVLNIDAHTDLRQLENRHSGNGFSYARKKSFLNKYAIFGLQQNYTSQAIFEEMDASEGIDYALFEDLISADKSAAFTEQLKFVSENAFGLEVDCDAIAGFPSSALSPSGFSLDDVRGFIQIAANHPNCAYLHVCEAIAEGSHPTGKAMAFLIMDFIKTRNNG